jgi:GT2 family glycosyltransferase/glycosyltransferase involved in cell wall biosynthesis
MPLPAAEILQPDCPVKPAWAMFDPVWYLKCYGDQLAGFAATPAGLLAYYLERGCTAGHAPSPLFDEGYYLAAHKQVAALVKARRYASGFDHFCQIGHRFHTGHWLFDDALYASLHDDIALDHLDGISIHGRYDHYLRCGQHEHRLAHMLWDSRFYAAKAIAAGDDARVIERLGPFTHFLYRLQTDAAELPPSVYFDPQWYRQQDAPGGQKFDSAIGHYLRDGNQAKRDPVSEFSEFFYRTANPDVQAAVEAGIYTSGYQHFLQTGVFEFRAPSADFDLLYYRDANSMVRGDLNIGAFRDVFAHLRAVGLQARLPAKPPPDMGIGEAAAKQLFIAKARDNVAIFARRKLDFSASGPSQISVIMVMCEKFELTMLSLSALRSNVAGDMQLVLVDNASCDASASIEEYVTGAKIIRLNRNIGYLQACNLALQEVEAELVLFLNNDVELGFGAIEAGISRIRSAADIGAVGGKIIRSHGLLQEAGCIIWRDGSTRGYMRDASPLAPEVNFVRDVDFCSGVFLLCRSAVVKNLGGFDPDFSPAYYEEADLCVRMAQACYRVVYDPAIVIRHLEYGSSGSPMAKALMNRGQNIFRSKHAAFLQSKEPDRPHRLTAARSPAASQKQILFIEDTVPLRRLGSGYVRANDVVHAIAAAGHAVSIFPVNGAPFDIAGIGRDLPETVEVLHDRDIDQLGEFLEQRRNHYDLIWVSRTHNLGRILPICLGAGIDPSKTPFVLDTEAIASVRDAGRMALHCAEVFDFGQLLRDELELARLCRHCVAVNEAEAGLLRHSGLSAVSVLGTLCRPDPTANGFAEREGILFVGSIHRPDSPNLDALHWYLKDILPALQREMANPPILNFAGHVAPEIDLSAFAGNPQIRIHGPAFSLRRHYAQNRLFIAPTRFAAGTPYKLYEAASLGLPSVATGLLARQLNWRDGEDLLTAPVGDAQRFAAQIAHLYDSPETWRRLRENVLARIVQENTPEAFNVTAADILDAALSSPAEPERLWLPSSAVHHGAAGNPVPV